VAADARDRGFASGRLYCCPLALRLRQLGRRATATSGARAAHSGSQPAARGIAGGASVSASWGGARLKDIALGLWALTMLWLWSCSRGPMGPVSSSTSGGWSTVFPLGM